MTAFDETCMRRALEIALRAEGAVEPNPMVGCVIARDERIVAEGWHERFGGPHAEINALAHLARAGQSSQGCDLYVTLEPCCHHGKTPPCVGAIVAAGIKRVVAAQTDPFAAVAGRGIAELTAAGVKVETGLCEDEARDLNAPYRKLIETGRPWVIAKWAMTLDGKVATASGDSRWISNESSRRIVHELRGRVDAILVGIGTALADDPLLTARPAGKRIATRVVLDSLARLPLTSQLVQTAGQVPLLVAAGPKAPESNLTGLRTAGCEVVQFPNSAHSDRLPALLDELGRRRMTNLLVEGGAAVFGSFFDQDLVDEVCVFAAPKIVGGAAAPSPVQGQGPERIDLAHVLSNVQIESIDGDVYVRGRIRRPRRESGEKSRASPTNNIRDAQ
jgi:diaminohydroxyphosphoribosylaminopyrimidine deaminase/5-amino-6-(5-phosphoribosylamino)uracil reductase